MKMARYNHFAEPKYKSINFSEISIGEKFRNDFHKGGIARRSIICIKTGELEYKEQKSGRIHTLFKNTLSVYSYNVLRNQILSSKQ